jgi:hypothetical protein
MTSINLSQSSVERKKQESEAIFDKSLLISLGIFVASFGTWGGLVLYDGSIRKQIAAYDSEITGRMSALEGDTINRLVDFDERSSRVRTKLAVSDVAPQEMFVLIEKTMVKGSSLDSYDYDTGTKTLTLRVISNDFKGAAQQVMHFKAQPVFRNVTVESASREEGGLVMSDVVIVL